MAITRIATKFSYNPCLKLTILTSNTVGLNYG